MQFSLILGQYVQCASARSLVESTNTHVRHCQYFLVSCPRTQFQHVEEGREVDNG